MDLSQPQSDAWHYLHDNEHTEVLFGGGAGGGKSMLGCTWQINERIAHPGTRGIICRKELKLIRESTLVTFFYMMGQLGYKAGTDYEYNSTLMTVTFSNESTITFKDLGWIPSDPNFERLGSSEYTDCFIDEAGEITEKAFDIITSRLRWMVKKGTAIPLSKVLLTCNPNNNWIKAKYIKKENKEVILKPYQAFVRALVTDNPDKDFAETYVQQLKRMNNTYDIARLLDGDWDVTERTGGEFYKSFDTLKHVKQVQYDPSLPLHLSWDKNVKPYLPCGVFQIKGKTVMMIDLFLGKSPNNKVWTVCDWIRSKYGEHTDGMFIYGDSTADNSDPSLEENRTFYAQIMQRLASFSPQKRVPASNPLVVPRGRFINAIMDSNYAGIYFMISDQLSEAINEFTNVKENAEGGKDKSTEKDQSGATYQRWGHISDLTDYIICKAFNSEYERFKRGGVAAFDNAEIFDAPTNISY